MLRNQFFFLVVLWSIDLSYSSISSICDHCSIYNQETKDLLEEFCTKHTGNLTERCCLLNNSIIGLDASNCKLKTLEFIDDVKSSLAWFSIVNNDVEKSINLWDGMRSMGNLTTLVLSGGKSCNGSFENHLVKHNMTICTEPVNKCEKDKDYCPDNSHCLQDGPGLSMCNCNEDWMGYRCLKKGGFPAYEWLIGFAVATVVICLTLRLMQQNGRKAGRIYKEVKKKEVRDNILNSGPPTPTPSSDD